MTENELKRCPFCGGEAVVEDNYDMDGYNVYCRNSECSFQPINDAHIKTELEAINLWNTRPIEAHQSALLAKAVEALKHAEMLTAGGARTVIVQTLAEINKGD